MTWNRRKHVQAVNPDAETPIIASAHYAVIGDPHEVIPPLPESPGIGRATDRPRRDVVSRFRPV